jgi:hypothetical protein
MQTHYVDALACTRSGVMKIGLAGSYRASARFQWQDGYAVLSMGERSLPTVLAYVRGQKEHHARGTTNNVLERIIAPQRKTKAHS